jgi:hypothetical protein
MSNTTEKVSVGTQFIVRRDHHRVSDLVYDNREQAKEEFDHWTRIVTRSKDGTKVSIEPYEYRS